MAFSNQVSHQNKNTRNILQPTSYGWNLLFDEFLILWCTFNIIKLSNEDVAQDWCLATYHVRETFDFGVRGVTSPKNNRFMALLLHEFLLGQRWNEPRLSIAFLFFFEFFFYYFHELSECT